MLRHSFVTTLLDADVDLRDVQIAARHADPCTTRRHGPARQNLDVDDLQRRGRGRPGPGAEPMHVVAVRLTAEELDAALGSLGVWTRDCRRPRWWVPWLRRCPGS